MVRIGHVVGLALLLGACEVVAPQTQQPAVTYYATPPVQVIETPYYYPPGCFALECTEPVYRSDGGYYWLTSVGFRLAATDAILSWPITRPYPVQWTYHHQRWNHWHWNTYRRQYDWNNRHWGSYYRQQNWHNRPPWQRPHRTKW